jgi:hypothetical protein
LDSGGECRAGVGGLDSPCLTVIEFCVGHKAGERGNLGALD